ncbi:myotubularin-related protein 9-like isoform X1 [Antedon mediterranea]|uniref:myotubularin-related protein 9-like isoform X1 n=2 Tax=Antedon mediterranea TaxID=105859 RepID=UPI003AF649FD
MFCSKEFHAMEFVEFIKTPKVDNVVLHKRYQPRVEGTLCLTGHHLILSSRKTNTEELWLLHSNIDAIEKKLIGSMGQLTIKCKNFKVIQLDIPNVDDCLNVVSSIESLSNIETISMMYPFFYRPMSTEKTENGWEAYLPEIEFNKMDKDVWRLSTVNQSYQVCKTYPHAVVVPKTITDDMLKQSASFRHGGRFPVLSYYHKSNKTSLLRSSQPLTGQSDKRCKDDEKLLNACLDTSHRGYIIDTRSQNASLASRTKGGGFESESNYSQWRRINKPLEKYSNLQESFVKLLEACRDRGCSMDKWLTRLESCSWLDHVKELLTTSCLTAQCVDKEGACVLVHGSEGLDATLQITSLAQVILDPDCRTMRGFQALIEREWIQAGHPFTSRCYKSAFNPAKFKFVGPVFLLFLDCVHQIHEQFPCSFEFSDRFLIFLFEHAYASQYGTFLCNNDAERMKVKLPTKTMSLWSYVNKPNILETFLNPLYQPNNAVLWPSVAAQSLTLWSSLFQRWELDSRPFDDAYMEIGKIREQDKTLKSQVQWLRRELAELQKEALHRGLISE